MLTVSAGLQAQLSTSAYRALGQPSLTQNGANLVQGLELASPTSIAIDPRNGATHIYIADLGNSRVLGWTDAASYQIGDPPAVVLGQPGPQYSALMGIGNKGFNQPWGMAVDPATANLYVADSGNNRILRFPNPFSNPSNYSPDAVIGQADFTTNAKGVSASALNAPEALAFDTAGNLWVADTGNNRVLRFPASVLDGRSSPQADIVLGQKDFTSNAANAGGAVSATGFSAPRGLATDPQNNLYVADFQNGRVLRFAAPISINQAAGVVIGQSSFSARVIISPPNPLTNNSMAGPIGIAVAASDTLYVAVPAENRVLMFPFGSAASLVYGQSNFSSSAANAGSAPFASQNGLWTPTDVKLDPSGNVYVVDSGNNRVLRYPPSSSNVRSANSVWGQTSFTQNGVNEVKPNSINTPYKAAIDYSKSPYPLYVSDAANHRILVWKDSVHFKSGDPADLVIGQPDLYTAIYNVDTAAQTPTATSLYAPRGIAVDASGNLYVADFGNNRVLRYPRPVDQQGRITADTVLGQASFTSSSAGVASASSLNGPSSVAIGPAGEVFVADTGNNRVLQFAPNPASGAAAIQVYGQPNFSSSGAPGAVTPQTLSSPRGVFVDSAYNLYVADTGANRVAIFLHVNANPGNGPSAQVVLGQASFTSGGAGNGGASLNGPLDVAVDSASAQYSVFVSDTGNSRVMIFPSLAFSTQQGQAATTGLTNASCAAPTASSLCGPVGIFLDRRSTLYVADALNNRVAQFLKAAPVVNAAHYQANIPVAPGSIATLKSPIQPGQTAVSGVPWPVSLGGWQVTVNDSLTAPMYFAGADATGLGQINFQVPAATASGANRIAVRDANTGELLAGGAFAASTTGPGLFSANFTGAGQGAILNQDGVTPNGASHPAPRGSVVSLYGTGQGPVNTAPSPLDGQPAAASPLSYSVTVPAADPQSCLAQTAICVIFGNSVFGNVQFSGLAPGFVGLWQVNVQIPSSAPTGNAVPVYVVLGGIRSNIVTMAIQ
ncbi:MAG TPA: hypothetical protein VKV74_16245 [Bryobacteraceae bacterium]|nr:hypothetical protein [Bryobacteraceae bacterium]